MKNILVVNGQFYAGKDAENKLILKPKRSEALVIEGQEEYKIVIGAVFCRVMAEELVLKRLEVIEVKEATNGRT